MDVTKYGQCEQDTVNEMNEINYGRWNEWDGLWTEGHEMEYEQWSW